MSQTLPPLVVAGDDSLDGVFARLRQAGANGRPVDLVVPADSALLLTAAEFRSLRDLLDRDRLAVTLRTDDSLRTQLARLLGIPVAPATPIAPPPSPSARPAKRPPSARPAKDDVQRAGPRGDGKPKATRAGPAPAKRFAGPVESSSGAQPGALPEAAEPAVDAGQPKANGNAKAAPGHAPNGEADIAPEREASHPDGLWPAPPSADAIAARRRASRGKIWSRRPPFAAPEPVAVAADAVPDGAVAPDVSPPVNGEATEEDGAAPLLVWPAEERRRRRARMSLIAAGALAAIVAIVYLLLPGATVAVSLKRQPLAGDVVYDITTTGQPLDGGAAIAVPAVMQSTDVTWEGQIPVTGVRVEPTDRAAAPILFANPNDAAAQVDAGARFTTETGVAFELVDAVTVPPRDPATGKAGQAAGSVRAVDPGSGGNVGVGEIGGRLPNGVYFSNREQGASGGAEKRIPIVAKADLDTLRTQAAAALPQAAMAAFAKALPGGQAIVPETIAAGPAAETFSAAAGDATGTLSLKVVWKASALAYDQ
ncbi:MAG TPA: hypothetical protein VFU81_01245, partial [Thermomicrobiales bacterium]|nr:hypothetical protein [Thermomicrobiales bacterium]